jgi:hypothetical protein
VEDRHGELIKFHKTDDRIVHAWNRTSHIGAFEYVDEQARLKT